jgi:hypothetical protein
MEFPNEGEGINQQMEEEDDNSDVGEVQPEQMQEEMQHDRQNVQQEEEDRQSISSDTEDYNKSRAQAVRDVEHSSPMHSPEMRSSPIHFDDIEIDNYSIQADTPDPTPAQPLRNPSLDRVMDDSLPNSQITPVSASDRETSYIPGSDYRGDVGGESDERDHRMSPIEDNESRGGYRAPSTMPSLPTNSNSFSLPSQTSPGRSASKSASVDGVLPDSSLPSIDTNPFDDEQEHEKPRSTSDTEDELEEDPTFILPKAPLLQVNRTATHEMSRASIDETEGQLLPADANAGQTTPKKAFTKVSQAADITSREEEDGNESDASTLIDEEEGGEVPQDLPQMDAIQTTELAALS